MRDNPTTNSEGVAVLVTQHGEVQHQRGYGFIKGRAFCVKDLLPYGQPMIAEHGGSGSGTGSGNTAARNWIRRHFKDVTTVANFVQENPQLHREALVDFVEEIDQGVLKTRLANKKKRIQHGAC